MRTQLNYCHLYQLTQTKGEQFLLPQQSQGLMKNWLNDKEAIG